ncbi:Putative LOC100748178, partial [Caligus rogercresseyi]
VYRLDKKGNLVFGTVVRDYEMMNMDDSDEEESSYLKKGEVLVSWYPKYTEKVHPNISLELGNRSLMPGDVVRKISSSSGGARSQTGYCREIKVKATVAVKCSNNRVIYNVDSSDLKPIHRFPSNSAVCLEPWVGVIRKIRLRLTLAFHDGISQCIVEDGAIASFEDVNDKEQKIPPFLKRLDYYPGMTLLGPLMVFEGAEWIACSDKLRELRDRKSKKPVKVTVLKAEVKEVSVNWQCQAFIDKVGSDPESGAPDLIVGEDLMKAKILGHFQSCTVQIGDRSYYTIKEDDVIISKNEWLEREKKLFVEGRRRNDDSRCSDESEAPTTHINPKRKVSLCVNKLKGRPLKKRSKNIASELSRNLPSPYNHVIPSLYPGETVVVEVLRTKAEVDVIWQDGSLEKGIDSSELFPMHHLDDNEFFTGEFVVKASDLGGLQTYGVIQSLDYQTRITKVKWFRTYTIGSEPKLASVFKAFPKGPISDGETEESVYDLRDHPDFNYRPGSVVIKVANFDNEEFEVGLGGEVVEVYPNGKVAVSWANKKMTECWPQDYTRSESMTPTMESSGMMTRTMTRRKKKIMNSGNGRLLILINFSNRRK